MGALLSVDNTEETQFKTLVARCFGDTEKAERLISYEFSHHNAKDREHAIELAIWRLEKDNR